MSTENQEMNTQEKSSKKTSLLKNFTTVAVWFVKQRMWVKIVSLTIFVAIIIAFTIGISNMNRRIFEVNAIASLEKIVNISELSTCKLRYGGVATALNEKNPEKVDYHVAYKADVYAGIDFEAIEITLNEQTKTVHIDIPEAIITEVSIDAESMEFMFINKKKDIEETYIAAKKLCEKDIMAEKDFHAEFIKMAKENAINTITLLAGPLIEQFGVEYSLEIN